MLLFPVNESIYFLYQLTLLLEEGWNNYVGTLILTEHLNAAFAQPLHGPHQIWRRRKKSQSDNNNGNVHSRGMPKKCTVREGIKETNSRIKTEKLDKNRRQKQCTIKRGSCQRRKKKARCRAESKRREKQHTGSHSAKIKIKEKEARKQSPQRLSLVGGRGRRPYRVGNGQIEGSRASWTGPALGADSKGGAGASGADITGKAARGASIAGEEASSPASGKNTAALSLSILTVKGFSLFRMMKVLAERSSTGYGPS